MSVQPQPPRIAPIHLAGLEAGDGAALVERESYTRLRFSGTNLSKRTLGWTGFTECAFSDVTADDCDLRESAFVQCTISRLSASTFSVPSGRFRSVRISQSRVGALVAYEAGWSSVEFIGVKIGF